MMAPRLVRFYGGTPEEWFARPWGVVKGFYAAIVCIRADEAGAQPQGGLGAGVIDGLREAMQHLQSSPKPVRRELSIAEQRAMLAGMGIKLEEVARA